MKKLTDGRKVMAIHHMTLWVRWAKKDIKDFKCCILNCICYFKLLWPFGPKVHLLFWYLRIVPTITKLNEKLKKYHAVVTVQINSCAKSTWYARRQHSYNICKDFLSHNSWMKNLNFTNSCTINMNCNIYTIFIQLKTTFFEKSVKTINSNNSTKFEVNWWRGSQFTARYTKNRLQFDE
jgi:hypothetical protein